MSWQPPAAARVDCLVLLAILAGCETLEMVGGYPLMKGRTAQLKFREHPVLGTVTVLIGSLRRRLLNETIIISVA
jgi:hypothetical protein